MSLISKETLLMQLQRAEMASEVTLPIDSFRDLLYQAMPKEWVGLTDEDIENCFDESCHLKVVDPKGGIKGSVNIFEVGRAIVQLCKERNT